MATEARNLPNLRNAPKTTAPRTNRLSSPACQPIMTVIITNKPNLLDDQMNVSTIITKDYENELVFKLQINEPNTNPNKPNFKAKKQVQFEIQRCSPVRQNSKKIKQQRSLLVRHCFLGGKKMRVLL